MDVPHRDRQPYSTDMHQRDSRAHQDIHRCNVQFFRNDHVLFSDTGEAVIYQQLLSLLGDHRCRQQLAAVGPALPIGTAD